MPGHNLPGHRFRVLQKVNWLSLGEPFSTLDLSGLTIYKASAGSGKTWTLARDYISMVITDPELFRHVLAVTFTNKATGEMKNRVLDELHNLSCGLTSAMMEYVASENNLSEKEVSARAEIILETILHNYSRFHIETIDRFFQRAIRSFTREIGLSGGYRIELDSDRVLSGAIDEMLDGLGKDPDLLAWFVEFAREKVQEGKHWNLKKDLVILGRELNRERFQERNEELSRQLQDKEHFTNFQKELYQIKYRFERSLEAIGEKALGIMTNNGLDVGDFKGQYGVGVFFQKLSRGDFSPPNNTVRKSVDEPSEWYAKTSTLSGQIQSAYDAGMNGLLRDCVDQFDRNYREYRSAEAVRAYLFTLGILTDISARMHEYTEGEGLFLLSDAARFLNGIIGENDAPFIYEKTGNYFHHYMIDEFQDTSGLQWKNFRPLIDNSLASGRKCLVVGDVKQSIYRWRNSDWEILSEQIHDDFAPGQILQEGLKQNWRSLENIIDFNNGFFSRAREVFREHFAASGMEGEAYAEKAKRAYTDVEQMIPDGEDRSGGYVNISLIPEPDEGDWKDISDQRVIQMIEEVQDRGITPSETAILVRSKRDGKRVADALLEHKRKNPESQFRYDVISNESLYLYNAISVRILVGALKYLVSPDNRVNLAQLIYEYHSFRDSGWDGNLDEILHGFRAAGGIPLPEGFQDESLRYLTLTELTERIISLFKLDSQQAQTPYILGFQDLVLNYSRNGTADINSFLKWWDEYGGEESLTVSEEQDAIKVMTIHKSKGLEFKTVIIPYCNWPFDHRSPNPEILWCRPRAEPFNQLSLLPVRYASSLTDTVFEPEYREENFRIYMDNLNLLYVAFTRARENLFVNAPLGKTDRFSDVSALLRIVLHNPDGIPGGSWDGSGAVWTLGSISRKPAESRPPDQMMLRSISSHEFSGKLRLMYRGLDFFDPESEQRVHHGTIMHEIFSRIRSSADIDRAIESARRDGIIDEGQVPDLRSDISEKISIETASDWFDGSWRVIAEQDILTGEGSLRRPDRVMVKPGRVVVVDYKFGSVRSSGHLTQVRKYADMLRQMDYEEVTGYVWYVALNVIVTVN